MRGRGLGVDGLGRPRPRVGVEGAGRGLGSGAGCRPRWGKAAGRAAAGEGGEGLLMEINGGDLGLGWP